MQLSVIITLASKDVTNFERSEDQTLLVRVKLVKSAIWARGQPGTHFYLGSWPLHCWWCQRIQPCSMWCWLHLAEFQFSILAAVWHSVTLLEKVGSKSITGSYNKLWATLSLQRNGRHVWCTFWQFIQLRIPKSEGMYSVENQIAKGGSVIVVRGDTGGCYCVLCPS